MPRIVGRCVDAGVQGASTGALMEPNPDGRTDSIPAVPARDGCLLREIFARALARSAYLTSGRRTPSLVTFQELSEVLQLRLNVTQLFGAARV